jgi:very-short-patch-repair endonuclease
MTTRQARQSRKRSTLAERLLWKRLRNRRVCDLKFRRQKTIGDRIVDFYCAGAQLAIELDGSGHTRHLNQTADVDKELDLHERGIRTLRFSNDAVISNLDGVVDEIIYSIDPQESVCDKAPGCILPSP